MVELNRFKLIFRAVHISDLGIIPYVRNHRVNTRMFLLSEYVSLVPVECYILKKNPKGMEYFIGMRRSLVQLQTLLEDFFGRYILQLKEVNIASYFQDWGYILLDEVYICTLVFGFFISCFRKF